MASEVSQEEELVEIGLRKGPGPEDGGRSRRHILKTLGAAVAGAVAGGLLSTKESLAHGGFHQSFNGIDPAIHGDNTDDGIGVEGTSANGVGVRGVSASLNGTGVKGETPEPGTGYGVHGTSYAGAGVFGESSSFDGGYGVLGIGEIGVVGRGNASSNVGVSGWSDWTAGVMGGSTIGDGVRGSSNSGQGVSGNSLSGYGVVGSSTYGTGLTGLSENGTALYASSSFGTALEVDGKARFTTAGSGTIAAGQDTATVSHPDVTGESHITVTLTGDPGRTLSGFPIVLSWVERRPGTGFIVHMTRRVSQATPFTYLIVDPSPN